MSSLQHLTFIELTAFERRLAYLLAVERTLANREAGVRNSKEQDGVPVKDSMQVEVDGCIAEVCYGKSTGRYPDLSTHLRRGGYDFINSQGLTIDVKATRHQGGRLMVPARSSRAPADFYVLMIVNDIGAWYAGRAAGVEVMRPENYVPQFKAYCIEQTQLKATRA